MKTELNSNFSAVKLFVVTAAISSLALITSCDDVDDPVKEDTPELITKATLTFTPSGGGAVVTATATDPDGEGVQDIETDGPITLADNTSYALTIQLTNELADPGDAGYNITEEVEEEGDEHMFFFSWTNNVFSDPAGNGNIDNRADDVNYNDEDDNGQPIGLETSWTTAAASSGKFQVVLKHQPELKTATSGSDTGETDIDIEFDINVE
jgi:hypothetical protein